ncbi:bZIP transcription factor 17-like [Silene latifolia]|uniref:bZIP transcription factor 17-like n=1 Tax=Silene latifolia TaxID=37657 RepID=UPI003D77B7EF
MEDPIAFDHHHHQQFQNDAVGLPTPPLDDGFPLFPELDDVTVDFGVDDFPFDVDFDLSFDDLSFADNLLQQPEPNSDPISYDVSEDPANPNFCNLGNNQTLDDVRVYDSPSMEANPDPNSSAGSNVGCSKSNSGVYSGNSCDPDVSSSHLLINNNSNDNAINSDLSRQMTEIEEGKTSNQSYRNDNSNDSSSKCVSKSKRKKGIEKDRAAETRSSKYRRSNSNVNATVLSSDDNLEGGGDEDEKKKARLIRNRESAHLSRQRKKQYVEELEEKVKSMVSTITDLNGKISYFMAENATLRQQLAAGGVGPPTYPMAPMPYPWMGYPPAYMVKPHGSSVPLVPIPRWKPQQPTPAPKVKKSSERKTKKVASVSLLGLLFFMLLFGGLVPMVNVRYGGVQKGSVFMVDKHVDRLPHGDGRFGHGRVVQELNSSKGGNTSEPLVASLYVPRNDKLVKIDGNLIIHSVLASEKAMTSNMAVGPTTSEETSLAIHGSYPPYPTPGPGSNDWRYPHLDRNQNGRQRALPSGSTDFTPVGSDGKLQQWFREGLAGPMLSSGMCTEVFQFDISPTPGSIVPATSVANMTSEDGLNSTRPNKTKNRRILHEHTIPPFDPTLNTTEDYMGLHEQSDGLQSNKSHSSVVVSVLVDPREVGDGDGEGIMGPKTLSRIFVVVLIDSVKYVTYSCMLPFMGSSSNLLTT